MRHPHPRPLLRRLGALALALALALAAAAIVLQIALALLVGPLFLGTALFSAILTLPLLLQSVLHPEIELSLSGSSVDGRGEGLYVRPMLWRAQFIPRAAILRTARHPLMQSRSVTDPQGRLLFGKNYRPREGLVVIVDGRAGLLPLYRLLAGMVGARGCYAFAIQSAAQRDYPALAATIASWVGGSTD